jgi:hypothetical protein
LTNISTCILARQSDSTRSPMSRACLPLISLACLSNRKACRQATPLSNGASNVLWCYLPARTFLLRKSHWPSVFRTRATAREALANSSVFAHASIAAQGIHLIVSPIRLPEQNPARHFHWLKRVARNLNRQAFPP